MVVFELLVLVIVGITHVDPFVGEIIGIVEDSSFVVVISQRYIVLVVVEHGIGSGVEVLEASAATIATFVVRVAVIDSDRIVEAVPVVVFVGETVELVQDVRGLVQLRVRCFDHRVVIAMTKK